MLVATYFHISFNASEIESLFKSWVTMGENIPTKQNITIIVFLLC